VDISVLIISILAPIVVGAALATVERRKLIAPWVTSGAMGIAIVAIYLMHEGLAPFPPISSKHKVAYALMGIPILGLLLHTQNRRRHALAMAVFAAVSFAWLIQRPLAVGRFEWHWLLPLGTIAAFVLALVKTPPHSRFVLPVTALSMSITASVVALLGGFLGLGQVLLSLSALVGGYALALFIDAFRSSSEDHAALQSIWSILGGLLILLVQLSAFATNLSLAAYLLLLALVALPLADPKLSRLPILVQPFAFAAVAALVGIPAILLAFLNF